MLASHGGPRVQEKMLVKIPKIQILGYGEAALLLDKDPTISHVISINDPGAHPPASLKNHKAKRLVLHMMDMVGYAGAPDPALTMEVVKKVLDFTSAISEEEKLLVHCFYGVSRSTAAAVAVIASRVQPTEHNALTAFQYLWQLRPGAAPHPLMISITDELLGWSGMLRSAYDRFFLEPIPLRLNPVFEE